MEIKTKNLMLVEGRKNRASDEERFEKKFELNL